MKSICVCGRGGILDRNGFLETVIESWSWVYTREDVIFNMYMLHTLICSVLY